MRFSTVVGASLFLTLGLGHASAAPVGITVKAATAVMGAGPNGSRQIVTDSPVFEGDRLSATDTGNAQIVLKDKTKIVVGPSAEIDIDEFAFASNNTFSKLTVKAAKGAFRFISGESDSAAYTIETPTGSIGVRGTAFDVAIAGDEAHVAVVRGAVELCPVSGACQLLRGWCSYGVMRSDGVDLPGKLFTQSREKRSRFPLMIDQKPLQNTFRHFGPKCTGILANRTDFDPGSIFNPEPTITTGSISAPAPDDGGTEPGGTGGDTGGSSNNSGHGDGTNPGGGSGNNSSGNTGANNPGGGRN